MQNPMLLELELLRTFVAVAESGGFRKAAERLHLTQSAVSQQVRRLEQAAGRQLFQRTTRTVALTSDGELLLDDARRLLQMEQAARLRLTGPRLSGMVRLGANEEVADGGLPAALGQFARSNPDVRLEVRIGLSAELLDRMDHGELDLVVAKRTPGGRRGRLLWREPMVWAAAASFDVRARPDLPLALYQERSVTREAALAALRRAELGWHVTYTSPSLSGVRAAALAGLALAPLPQSALGPGLRALGEAEGLPVLPEIAFALFVRPAPDRAISSLAQALGETLTPPGPARGS
jgi:DNA-binding transcriptional LysR family regulator